jgi:hypothetical protein
MKLKKASGKSGPQAPGQDAVKSQTTSELKGNATVAETPGSNKSERTGKARRPDQR